MILFNNDSSHNIDEQIDAVVVNAQHNVMLVGAYEFALQCALKNQAKWLLLLDQDSHIDAVFAQEINGFLKNKSNTIYAAAVTKLFNNNTQLSPIVYKAARGPFLFYKPFNSNHKLLSTHCVSAYNSCSVLNVAALSKIGGFNTDFPLDMLDHSYFYAFFKANYPIYVFGSKVQHALSLRNKNEMMPLKRYNDYVAAQQRFASNIGKVALLHLKVRWLIVFVLQIRKFNTFSYSKITLKRLLLNK